MNGLYGRGGGIDFWDGVVKSSINNSEHCNETLIFKGGPHRLSAEEQLLNYLEIVCLASGMLWDALFDSVFLDRWSSLGHLVEACDGLAFRRL